MLEGIRAGWHRLKEAPPGERFQREYRFHQEARKHRWTRPLMLVLGALVILGGLVALPAPGPGMLVIAVGAGLLARESITVARALDRLELWAMPRLRRLRRFWARLPDAGRAAIVLGGLVLAALAAAGVYYLWLTRG